MKKTRAKTNPLTVLTKAGFSYQYFKRFKNLSTWRNTYTHTNRDTVTHKTLETNKPTHSKINLNNIEKKYFWRPCLKVLQKYIVRYKQCIILPTASNTQRSFVCLFITTSKGSLLSTAEKTNKGFKRDLAKNGSSLITLGLEKKSTTRKTYWKKS